MDNLNEWESLRKFLQQDKQDSLAETVLGSIKKVDQFSLFWGAQSDGVMLAAASSLHSLVATQQFTKEEFDAYRKGLYSMVNFFRQCAGERARRVEEAQKQKRRAELIAKARKKGL